MHRMGVLAIVLTGVMLPATDRLDAKKPVDLTDKIHIPIGIPNTLDSLKTFVQAEGCFSPGIGSYGIYYRVYDRKEGKLTAPAAKDAQLTWGLADDKYLIPWTQWSAGPIKVRTELCQIVRRADGRETPLVGSRARITNTSDQARRISVYAMLRPMGPAGFNVRKLAVSPAGDALLADGFTAIVARPKPSAAGVLDTDTIEKLLAEGKTPKARSAVSKTGDCSGALRFDMTLEPGKTQTVELVCPVLPGRRAVRHQWTPRRSNYIDTAVPQSDADGIDIADAGLDYYRKLAASDLFAEAVAYWKKFYGKMSLRLPDARWTNGYLVMLAHAGLCMNEGAADVAVLNYPVYNRDGMYIANMMQKSGRPKLSEAVIDYFLAHPFNGRPFPEADNPGQILWSIGQHWKFTRDRRWLARIYPSAEKIARMIRYYRTTKGPHWVSMTSLDCGENLPKDSRVVLRPGRCDGNHPEYTEAFDLTGLRVVAELGEILGKKPEAQRWAQLADQLAKSYDRFAGNLGKGYGGYAVLWPCRLYPLGKGKAHDQFRRIGKKNISHWRYFAPATAHQGLLAGNRQAGHGTVNIHLDHPHMQRWFAFDEGGSSGSGGWYHLRTKWRHSKTQPDGNRASAMPHGWAIAEVWLLMRDSLLFEDGDRLVLFGGIDPRWFTEPTGMELTGLPTHFGLLSLKWKPTGNGALLQLTGTTAPPGGFLLRLPKSLATEVVADGKTVTPQINGDYALPKTASKVQVTFDSQEP
ncbi:MAG: hypothetical protein QGG42_19600 [Phycisphaerae bacterium]|nr:hypothetical protein [Phycisphaerae bacterium]